MTNAMIDCVLRWRRKLDEDKNDDYIQNVLGKLSEVPMTLEILEVTHIGKTIRKLTKRDDIIGEKAMTILKKWREAFTTNCKKKNVKEDKSSSNYTSPEKTVYSQKQTSNDRERNNSVSPSLSEQSSKKYINGGYETNNFTETSHSLYKCSVKEGDSKYLDYDPCTEASTSYNPECPEFFPSNKPMKTKKPLLVETYEPSLVKRKLTDEKQRNEIESRHKKFKSSKDSNSGTVVNTVESKKSQEKKDKHKEKAKDNSHSSSLKNESSKEKLNGEKAKKHELSSDVKKTKTKEPSKNDRIMAKETKIKIHSAEEFTSSEVSFEDCLGFNDIVTVKKNSKSHSSRKTPSSNTPSKEKSLEKNKKDSQKTVSPVRKQTVLEESYSSHSSRKAPSSNTPSKEKSLEKNKKDSQKTVSPVRKQTVLDESYSYSSKEKIPKYTFLNSDKTRVLKDSYFSDKGVLKNSHFSDKEFPFTVPKPVNKLDVADITSSLLEIQPNFRLLPRNPDFCSSKKKEVSSNEDTIKFTTSRREKTAVYSGRKNTSYRTEVPSLFDLCTRILIENIDAIECVGDTTFEMMKPVLERCTPSQLYNIENYNPAFIEDTNDLWAAHCKRDFKLVAPVEHETWRELYWRAQDERESKLESVKKHISKSISVSTPVRQIKLAYIDSSYIKPPRDVAKKQDKYGTAAAVSHVIKPTLASKTALKPSVPALSSDSLRNNSSSNVVKQKPIIAPLMKKTLKSLKAFRRK